MTFDALVIGAGPAGATAALMLARAGWSVAVIEKSPFPRRKVCGEFVSATSLPLLQELGIADAFLNLAGPEIRRVGLFAGETVLTAPMPWAASPTGAWGRALGREHLDCLLLDAARSAGARVFQPWAATELRPTAHGHACTIASRSDRKQIHTRVVIAACGSWERGPRPLRHDRAHRPSDLMAFKAHFRDSDLPPDLMPLLIFPGGYGGMVHADQGRVSLSCCIRRDALQRCRAAGPQSAGAAALRHIRAACTGVDQSLRHARLDQVWLSAGPIRPGIRQQFAQGIFAIGNLAGEAHPIVAEGISMAMQSAWLLCRSLIAHQACIATEYALDQVAREYAAAWRASFAPRTHAAALYAHVAQWPRAIVLSLAVLRRFPEVLTFGARLSGKVTQIVPTPVPRSGPIYPRSGGQS